MRLVNVVGILACLAVLLSGQTKQVRPLPPLATKSIPSVGPKTFTGRITDSVCARADHKSMGMGDTDAECAKACVQSHGAQYVLFDGTNVYVLGDQVAGEQFAGQKVAVKGVLNAKTGTIEKISSVKAVK